ncbi:uncharacterized protein [Watersipora subatra]|uniref:uncharacterized protein n=1 Tax=Watersipora subatra TaxID=2589382 RepID=UPI00355C65C0
MSTYTDNPVLYSATLIDPCDRCIRAPNPCPPASSACNPTIKAGMCDPPCSINYADPCNDLLRSTTCDDPCPPIHGSALLNNCRSDSSSDNCNDEKYRTRTGKFLGSWTNCYEDEDDVCGSEDGYHLAPESMAMNACRTSKEKLAFTIKDACNLTTDKSLPCSINGLCWTLVVSVKRVDCDMWLGIFLTCKAPGGDCRSFSCKVEDLRLSLIDQCNPKRSVCKKISSHCFTETESNWGVQSVCCWDDIINPKNNFRLDNTLRVKAEFNIYPVKWC